MLAGNKPVHLHAKRRAKIVTGRFHDVKLRIGIGAALSFLKALLLYTQTFFGVSALNVRINLSELVAPGGKAGSFGYVFVKVHLTRSALRRSSFIQAGLLIRPDTVRIQSHTSMMRVC